MSKYECNICGYQTGELYEVSEEKELKMHLEIEHPPKSLPKGQQTLNHQIVEVE